MAVSSSPGQMEPGEIVDGYRIVRRLGAGGFSHTYEAIDERTGATVVLKVPNLELIGDPQTFERFRREMQIARRLDHPNIQHAGGEVDDPSLPYLVLEYIDGETLREFLRGRLPLDPDQAVGYAVQLAHALSYAHAHGVAHRDLKPENVLVTRGGQLKLSDFGIALLSGARRVTWRWLNDGIGTPDYMAPEQIQGKRGDARTDIYALGTMLYEMLAGRVPWSGDNALAVMNQVINTSPEPLHLRSPRVSPPLEAVVHKAMRKDPDERYQSADAMLHDLEHLDDVDLSQFVTSPERYVHKDISFRSAMVLGTAIAVAFVLVIVLAVVLTMVLTHK
ncbi:MAG: serine/threonine protein kinase [Candidatus Dormibacteraeota bacterium]|nr:serine/threonine protein kinase [Candidatus Dormibacteraeota bacterium]